VLSLGVFPSDRELNIAYQDPPIVDRAGLQRVAATSHARKSHQEPESILTSVRSQAERCQKVPRASYLSNFSRSFSAGA
jgi:hypothetical protein